MMSDEVMDRMLAEKSRRAKRVRLEWRLVEILDKVLAWAWVGLYVGLVAALLVGMATDSNAASLVAGVVVGFAGGGMFVWRAGK